MSKKALFADRTVNDFLNSKKKELVNEVDRISDEELLKLDDVSTKVQYLVTKHKIEPLVLSVPKYIGIEPDEEKSKFANREAIKFEVAVYDIELSGEKNLIFVQPAIPPRGAIYGIVAGKTIRWRLRKDYHIITGNKEVRDAIKVILKDHYAVLESFTKAINEDVAVYNTSITKFLSDYLTKLVDDARLRKETDDDMEVDPNDFK